MQIKVLTVGPLRTNCYLVTEDETNKTLIIDPGDEADFISTTILENKLLPQAIILTHGHYDHCLGALELKLNFGLPIYLHQADNFLYQKAPVSAKHFSKINIPKLPPIDHFIENEELVSFGSSSLQVLHTPGHTPGSICLYSEPYLFTGDTIFATGIGTANHKYSSKPDLQKSLSHLKSIIHNSKFTTHIYPGHEDYGLPYQGS